MSQNEMVERVAKAMWAGAKKGPGQWPESAWKMFLTEARTAIEHMREPTYAMLERANVESFEEIGHDRLEKAWKAMIDEALK